jgi:hypothetical protein
MQFTLRLPFWPFRRTRRITRTAGTISFLKCSATLTAEQREALRTAIRAQMGKIMAAYLVDMQIETEPPRPAVALQLAPGVSANQRQGITTAISRAVKLDTKDEGFGPTKIHVSHGLAVCVLDGQPLADAQRVGEQIG